MIRFSCEGCGRSFSVPDSCAGRSATCKTCGAKVVVPAPPPPPAVEATPAVEPAPAKIPLRLRRLAADERQMKEAFAASPFVRVLESVGEPPEIYRIEYRVNGLERGKKGEPSVREHHVAEIRLTADYPRLAPKCKMITPIFHPNIDPTTICVGDHWTAGERLSSLVVRIGELIAYQAYNIKSPLDAEAAMWADLNSERLPIDNRNFHPADL